MTLSADTALSYLRAAGEGTRLRILALLGESELAVSELVQILAQSQPRLSHHLKILARAGLVDRLPEGAWVFYRWPQAGPARGFLDSFFNQIDRSTGDMAHDRRRLEQVRQGRRSAAEQYFADVADTWDAVRSLHYSNDAIEAALLERVAGRTFSRMIDIGSGTGRMLTLLADHYEEAEGVDFSHQMLTVARANIEAAGVTRARVRFGEATATPFDNETADLVTIHQVLHFLDEPEAALGEAARLLKPGGQLIIVDFAPHTHEFLRSEHGHRRLGLREDDMAEWATRAGLQLGRPARFEGPDVDGQAGLCVCIWLGEKCPAQNEKAA